MQPDRRKDATSAGDGRNQTSRELGRQVLECLGGRLGYGLHDVMGRWGVGIATGPAPTNVHRLDAGGLRNLDRETPSRSEGAGGAGPHLSASGPKAATRAERRKYVPDVKEDLATGRISWNICTEIEPRFSIPLAQTNDAMARQFTAFRVR